MCCCCVFRALRRGEKVRVRVRRAPGERLLGRGGACSFRSVGRKWLVHGSVRGPRPSIRRRLLLLLRRHSLGVLLPLWPLLFARVRALGAQGAPARSCARKPQGTHGGVVRVAGSARPTLASPMRRPASRKAFLGGLLGLPSGGPMAGSAQLAQLCVDLVGIASASG